MATGTIRIRYKHSDLALGDMASFNAHNQPGKFPAPKHAGFEEEIPATLFDNKIKKILYKNPDRSTEFISEREKRRREHLYGGFAAHSAYFTPAPAPMAGNQNTQPKILTPSRELTSREEAAFFKKQEIALHYLKEFNPICMEIVGDLPDEVMALAKKEHPEFFEDTPVPEEEKTQNAKDAKKNAPKITEMDSLEAVKIINQIKDPDLLREFRDQEIRVSPPRPMVLTSIDAKLREVLANG